MAWTNISNGAVAVGGIPSSTTVTALRDNPGAMAAAENGAPVIFAGWHPYNKTAVGGTETGLIYDFAVNGVQAEVVTPDFQDGFEYRLIAASLSHNNGAAATIQIELYEETTAAYSSAMSRLSDTNGVLWHFDLALLMPRLSVRTHWLFGVARATAAETVDSRQSSSTEQKILRAKIKFSAGSIDSGKIWMLRRAEYLTGL